MPAILADIQRKYGESVYPLYKGIGPYMENVSGKGYQGVVLYDELEDKVQCSECGKWVAHMASHLHFKHKMKANEYKDKYGLYQKTALCSKKVSRNLSERGKENLTTYWVEVRNNKGLVAKKKRNQFKTMQHKNTGGWCPAQIEAALINVRDQAGKKELRNVTSGDVNKYAPKLYQYFQGHYGSMEKACKELQINFLNNRQYDDSMLIAKLRNFVREKGFIPYSNKLIKHGLPSFTTYLKYFGSWRRAKMMAGLDQLLEEVKSA